MYIYVCFVFFFFKADYLITDQTTICHLTTEIATESLFLHCQSDVCYVFVLALTTEFTSSIISAILRSGQFSGKSRFRSVTN